MGIAIIVPNKNYAPLGYGTVTPSTHTPVTALAINSGSQENNTIQLDVTYYPSSTDERGVTWAILSGSEYATINSDGLLSVGILADNSEVTVQATSTVNSSIKATKTLTITREAVVDVPAYELASGSTLGDAIVLATDTPASKDCKLNKIYCGLYVAGMAVDIFAVRVGDSVRQIGDDVEITGAETVLSTPIDIYAGESVGFRTANKGAVRFANQSSDFDYFTCSATGAAPTWYRKNIKGNLGYKCV